MSMPIAVVTGGSGFVGSHLVDYLLDKNFKVRCIVRESSNLRWLEGKDVEIYKCGLFDKEGLEEVLTGTDYLFHVAGVVKAKKWEGYYRGNVETTENLLDVTLKVNPDIKKVVIVSSQTACGPSLDGKPCTEETEPHPITRYGKSKLEQEKLASKYMDKLPISIVRPPAVYGERDTEIYLFFKTYKSGLMSLIGFDNKLVSIINVHDLVEGIYLAGIKEEAKGQTYFISSEEYYNWPKIGEVTSKAFGKKALTIRLPHFLVYTVAAIAQFFSYFSPKAATFNIEKARDFVQKYWICDTSKAKKELGYSQKISLEEGIKQTIDWYKENNWL
ncbi:MAG: NAD-dependent epimerase/dehydratase family protein [Ignavibacteria bacterium]|nr:MAG: NAD-dependent epimerase/dehydratase family protein [Ignavibacteria bacterium]